MKKILAFALLLLFLALASILWLRYWVDAPNQLAENKTVIIPKGTGFMATVDLLAQENIITHPTIFAAVAAMGGQASQIKAGEYEFFIGATPRNVLTMLTEGRVVIHKITVPEGFNVREILDMLNKENVLTGEPPTEIAEGTLLPETYYFTYGDTRAQVIERMRAAMQQALHELWSKRKDGLPLKTPQEALTLASIVEKETGVDGERGRVAAVYINRLRKGMKLQADPTTQYGIELAQGAPMTRALTLKDLQTPTPYNTYVIDALPPGPIANPGREALAATLNPPDTEDLFFVATGNGGHWFAKTAKEHAANVAKYRAAQRTQ